MRHDFTIYIDESGDQGFRFGATSQDGSSRWFILSAVLIRSAEDAAIISAADEIRRSVRMQAKQTIHFADLSHEKRLVAVTALAALPVTLISIMVDKQSVHAPERFANQGFRLYFYAARLLMERISWYCRDHAGSGSGAGRARLIFEHCKNLNYDALYDYFDLLRSRRAFMGIGTSDIDLHWGFYGRRLVEVYPKRALAGLQMADCAASSMRWALQPLYGFTEPRYARTLAPRFYRRNGALDGYGLKFLTGTVPIPGLTS